VTEAVQHNLRIALLVAKVVTKKKANKELGNACIKEIK
jgi:hypothetical protein